MWITEERVLGKSHRSTNKYEKKCGKKSIVGSGALMFIFDPTLFKKKKLELFD